MIPSTFTSCIKMPVQGPANAFFLIIESQDAVTRQGGRFIPYFSNIPISFAR